MTAHASGDAAIVHAELTGDGVLLSADAALLALNTRAGGMVGAPIAVPQLAAIVRLARRLGIPVSRRAVIADDEVDLDLWVRAMPGTDTIRLSVGGWRELQPWRAAVAAGAAGIDFLRSGADWRWETDAALRLTFVSPDAAPRLGFDPLALLGKPLTSMVALDTGDDEAAAILDAMARRSAMDAQRARLRGSGRAVILTAVVRHDITGAFAGFVGSGRLADEEPRDHEPGAAFGVAARAPVPDQLSPTFTAGLDRALRTPLARIVANADSIHAQTDGLVQPDYADYAADIANAGRHLLALVDDLVDLQAVERPDFTLLPEAIDLADIARRAGGLLAVRAANAEVTILRPGFDETVMARGDFRRVLQILVNLIGNALRYSPAGAAVTVTATTLADRATVIVADVGKGVAPADHARIFDKFERVDVSEPGGNGLGLYIARRLARAMHGDLTVDSAIGEGARFVLSLPTQATRDEDQD